MHGLRREKAVQSKFRSLNNVIKLSFRNWILLKFHSITTTWESRNAKFLIMEGKKIKWFVIECFSHSFFIRRKCFELPASFMAVGMCSAVYWNRLNVDICHSHTDYHPLVESIFSMIRWDESGRCMCEIKRIMHIPYEIVKTVHWHFGVFSSVKYLWRGIVLCALAGDCSSNTCHLFPHTQAHNVW